MLEKIRTLLLSPYYSIFLLLLSAIGYTVGGNALIAVLMIEVQLVALVLCLSDDLAPVLLPTLCVIVLGTTLIGKMELITPWIPYGLTLVPAFVFHFICYRRAKVLCRGVTLSGLIATAAAILLSGIGNLDSTDYTDPTVWYYLCGMSVLPIVLYLIFASEVKREKRYDQMEYFLGVLVYVGILSAAVIGVNFVKWAFYTEGALQVKDYFDLIPYRNTIANILLLCLPAPFYFAGYAEKHPALEIASFSVGCLFYGAMVLTAARTAMLFGSILLLISLVYYFVSKRAWYYKVLNFVIVAALITLLAYYLLEPITQLITSRLDGGLASVDEARWKLLLRSISDFKEHPLFGIGFCSTENADIYAADGCISWYHLYFPQIWGSLGLVGCVAFLYQLAIRARLAIFRPNATTVALALSYLGILLYSQTDPGEFVPIPFAALAVLIFVYLEKHYENEKGRTTWFIKCSDLIKKEKSLP